MPFDFAMQIHADIPNAVLKETNAAGEQRYVFGPKYGDCIWICREDAHPTAKPGMRGTLVYQMPGAASYYRFVPA